MSGFSDDAPESLTRGKPLTSILFDLSDMDAIFQGQVTFKQVLDFKMRQAGETGKPYVPYRLPEVVKSIKTTQITSYANPYFGVISSAKNHDLDSGMAQVLLMCEGYTDGFILSALFGRVLNLEQLKQEIMVQIITMGGMQNWINRLSEIINIKLNSLEGHLDGIVVFLDSDNQSDAELNHLESEIQRSVKGIAISAPLHVMFAKPDIAVWIGLDRKKYPKEILAALDIKEILDTVDIDYFIKNNPEMQGAVRFLNSLIEEDLPLWESDAIKAVKMELEEAEWGVENKTVTLYPSHDDRESVKICRSIEDLKLALAEIAEIGAMNSMPFESGEAVFEVDYDSIVQEILIDYYSEQIEELGWEL